MQLVSQRTTISGHLIDSATHQQLTDGGVSLADAAGHSLTNTFINGASYVLTAISRSSSFFVSGSSNGYHGAYYPNIRSDCSSGCSVPAGATAVPGNSTNIDIALDPHGSITGTVTDAATGQPVPNVEVLFYWANGTGYAFSSLTNANGFYIAGWTPGSFVAYTTGGTYYQTQIYNGRPCNATPCDPTPGDVVTLTDGVVTPRIDFHLNSLNQYGAISGHVVDAETGLPMPSVYVDVGSFSARTDSNGYYFVGPASNVSPGLATGSYKLYAETEQPYFIGLSGGGSCEDFYACRNNGTLVQVTAPNTTAVDFRMIKLRVTSVSPAYGTTTGGTRMTINGANFTPEGSVFIGNNAATIVSITSNQIVALTPPGTAGAAHVTVRLSPSLAVTLAQPFTYLPSATFTDDPIVAGVTPVRAAHLIELRTAVNNLRAATFLPDYAFTDADPSGAQILAVHILELRTALNQARAALGLPALTYQYSLAPGNSIHAIDVNEIRAALR
jgi:5-hydroxyisourate hydrolase-like protein (transthyretin family)